MAVSVEEVSSSLVREYLSRKGLKRTIACMDEENPRTEASINNRSRLRQVLNIEALYRKNKVLISPLKTLLEIIVKHHMEDDGITGSGSDCLNPQQTSSSSAHCPAATSTNMNDTKANESTMLLVNNKHSKLRSDNEVCLSPSEADRLSRQTGYSSYDSKDHKGQPLMFSPPDEESFSRREADKKTPIKVNTQRSSTNRTRRGMMAGPVASTTQDSNRKRQNQRLEVSQPLLRNEKEKKSWDGIMATGLHEKSIESSLTENSSAVFKGGSQKLWNVPETIQNEKVGKNILTTTKVRPRLTVAELSMHEMVLDDIDDDDDQQQDLHKVCIQRTVAEQSYKGCPMEQSTAMELKVVLFGSSLKCFSVEWRNQGFTFSETHDLRYGIVQKKGGPCGVLASLQAFVLKKLLFENTESSNTGLQRLRPSNTARRKSLVLAVAEILWRAGEEKQATVAISSGRNHFTPTGHYKSEGLLEKTTCFTVDSFKDLQLLIEQHIEQFETGVFGCILLTISAILSRSIEKVRADMDVPSTTLIGAHGYCTQELVNLLLCGRAVSNVFDNDMELDSGNGNMTLLKGIKAHSDIGFLSLFEHYNICKVGAYLKTPRYPIWVVCSESHFSVLFGLQRELLTSQGKNQEFDLYYYDGLANQQEEIRLTVSVGNSAMICKDDDTDLIPPLEHCIRTRWKDALVNWNDTEPIL
ncbi:hypothetical protein Q5P01_015975 [Channa striata]|uniref:Ubiquitin carboxyl-terminal hydrolase MINDY n=1 Tax=Channa striata TaxID=64152 RepID=A0AA88MFG7_CHASR|nr:hypothetical protein Q5P01_015975 [Channa striata]